MEIKRVRENPPVDEQNHFHSSSDIVIDCRRLILEVSRYVRAIFAVSGTDE